MRAPKAIAYGMEGAICLRDDFPLPNVREPSRYRLRAPTTRSARASLMTVATDHARHDGIRKLDLEAGWTMPRGRTAARECRRHRHEREQNNGHQAETLRAKAGEACELGVPDTPHNHVRERNTLRFVSSALAGPVPDGDGNARARAADPAPHAHDTPPTGTAVERARLP